MSEFTQEEYDIIMSEKPKADTNESYKGFLDMKLHTEAVSGTGKGKGSDDWDLGDLMKIKAEEQPKLPPGETPDMMFDTPYIKDEPLMTSSTVKTKHINSLFGPHVTFDDKKNRTYVFDEQVLSNNPVAIRMREYRRRKKEGTKVIIQVTDYCYPLYLLYPLGVKLFEEYTSCIYPLLIWQNK